MEGLEILFMAGSLKRLQRGGFQASGYLANPGDTVASHSWRVALLVDFLSEDFSAERRLKLIRLALYHDLPEAFLGDAFPPAERFGGRPDSWRALEEILRLAPTPEEKVLVKDADLLETAFHLREEFAMGRVSQFLYRLWMERIGKGLRTEKARELFGALQKAEAIPWVKHFYE